jgi:hypothetical protein
VLDRPIDKIDTDTTRMTHCCATARSVADHPEYVLAVLKLPSVRLEELITLTQSAACGLVYEVHMISSEVQVQICQHEIEKCRFPGHKMLRSLHGTQASTPIET